LGLVDDVAAGTCVDLSRVYVAGFSLGGMFAMKLACLAPERIAAIGVVAGLIDIPCDRDRPVPLIAFQGTDDMTVRLDGTYEPGIQLLLQGASRPRPETAATWAAQNGCDPEPNVVDDPGTVTTTYRCPAGSEVELVLTKGGTHNWPHLAATPPPDGGPGDTAVDATQQMWEFFERAQR
jgi:polyhydroxybutyrate depolymerase